MHALVLALSLQTLLVDAGGGGDHLTIQAAVDAAAPGDTILVAPGPYAGFSADKALTILGPGAEPRPLITGDVAVAGAARFTLAGLRVVGTVACTDVPGRLELDELDVTGKLFPLALTRCGEALVQRTLVTGVDHEFFLYLMDGAAAVRIEDSVVTAVGCEFRGGDGNLPGYDYAPGAVGVRAHSSLVTLVATDVAGGVGGTFDSLGSFCEPGGDGVYADGSAIIVRGLEGAIDGGDGGYGCQSGASAELFAATLVHSGVAFVDGIVDSFFSPPNTVINPPNEPLLTLLGGDAPGATRRLLVHAKQGQVGLVIGALPAPGLPFVGVEGAIWLDFAAPVFVAPVTGAGMAAPIVFPFVLPASLTGLEGVVVTFQAAFPGVPGTLDPTSFMATNPVDAVLRY